MRALLRALYKTPYTGLWNWWATNVEQGWQVCIRVSYFN